jgi:hypothetical protein
MGNIVKRATAGAALGGSLFFTAGLGIALAQPDTADDDLVNLTIGNVSTLEDVNIAAAAQIAAAVCGVDVGPVTTSVEGVDTTGTETVVCTNNLGAISVSQNGSGQSDDAPGIDGETPTSPTTTTTTTTTTAAEGG